MIQVNFRYFTILRSGDVAYEMPRGARNRPKSSIVSNVYSGNSEPGDSYL